jgi:class 3 adenylate cyclase
MGQLDGKNVVTAFIRDVSLEKKSAELLAIEKANSEKLLLNVIPAHIAVRLKNGETNISEQFDDVTVLFSDLAGFTAMSSNLTSQELIVMLNTLVSAFDALTIELHVEKIKTIGDAFFAVGGLDSRRKNHPQQVVQLGVDMLKAVARYNVTQRP